MTADSLDRFAKEVDGAITFTIEPDLGNLDQKYKTNPYYQAAGYPTKTATGKAYASIQ